MKWMGVTHGVPQVATLAEDLAKILRASISGDEFVTLGQELDLLERYIAHPAHLDLSDRFACEIEVDDALMSCMVPKLRASADCGKRGDSRRSGYGRRLHQNLGGARCGRSAAVFVQDNGCGMEKPAGWAAGLRRIRQTGRASGHV